MHHRRRMARLAWLSLFAAIVCYGAGCTRKAPCSGADCDACVGLDEASCNADARCRADYCSECSCTPTFVGCVAAGAERTLCPAIACPALRCGGCDGLDEQSCVAGETTLGCTPEYCPACDGGHTFVGCFGPGEAHGVDCAAPVCNTGCHSANECSSNQECLPPGASPGCGACRQGTDCTSDAACPSGQVCDVAECSCSATGKTCVPSCATTGCAVGESCGADGHCAPTPCASSAQCPVDFDCVLPPAGGGARCERRGCTVDGDCVPGNYCVDGGCYGALGMCSYPAA